MLQVKRRAPLFLHLTQGGGCIGVVVAVVIVASVVVFKIIVQIGIRPNCTPTQVQSHLSAQVQHHFRLLLLTLLLILLLVLRVLFAIALNVNIISMLANTAVVVGVVGAPRYVTVAAVAEVETLLGEVEALVVGAGQVQAIDTAQVQPIVGTRVGRGQTNLVSGKPVKI